MSERRAYRLVGLSRDSYRHPPQPDAQTAALQGKIVEVAQVRCPLRLPAHPRSVAAGVSRRQPQACVYRLYSEARLDVRKRKKVRRAAVERAPLQLATTVNEVWSMDFLSDSLVNGRRHQRVAVPSVLDQPATFHGHPADVRTVNAPEFTSRAFVAWAISHGIRHILNVPGKFMQDGYIESFNGKFCDECLNEQWFQPLHQARCVIADWRRDFDEVRPQCLSEPCTARPRGHELEFGSGGNS